MNVVVCAASALSVAVLFYSWRSYHHQILQQRNKLRERVAYMLWVMATSAPDAK